MYSSDPTFPLFPIISFLGFILGLIPLSWHLQAWNAGTCAFMLWSSISCLIEFINCLIWSGNVLNPSPIWCDISSKFLLGAGVGITASTLCITRRLHSIATAQVVSYSRQEKLRVVIIDLLVAVGLPVLVMVLHYIVQPHRFDILEDIGCYPAVYNTLPAYFLVFQWPVTLGAISFVYSALTIRAFWRRRMQFRELTSSNPSLSVGRYLRLVAFAFMDMMLTVSINVFEIYIGTQGVKFAPWISWSDTHFNFSRVNLVPAVIWRSDVSYHISIELTRWLFPLSSFIFFSLFGFASEAQKQYSKLFSPVTKFVKSSRSNRQRNSDTFVQPTHSELEHSSSSNSKRSDRSSLSTVGEHDPYTMDEKSAC